MIVETFWILNGKKRSPDWLSYRQEEWEEYVAVSKKSAPNATSAEKVAIDGAFLLYLR